MTDLNRIRNFCIIAHIDHGKSTLADRMLQITGTVVDDRSHARPATSTGWISSASEASPSSPTGRPASPIRCQAMAATYILNLIDTPGHVDFTYEVSSITSRAV
jgi:GTP-binding protein LepA